MILLQKKSTLSKRCTIMSLFIYNHVNIIKLDNHLEDTKVSVPFTKPNAENAY